jgi:hypothetical protein
MTDDAGSLSEPSTQYDIYDGRGLSGYDCQERGHLCADGRRMSQCQAWVLVCEEASISGVVRCEVRPRKARKDHDTHGEPFLTGLVAACNTGLGIERWPNIQMELIRMV